ncbi:MAG: hypothetical protein COS57_06145 [Syntrophobacterales bacterium CG03_land_8_20_14_0_80_58_14]|nr:MAG: hypothetical protein COS57_06145 [Syntrophobacterales bacterium CG03_land_8_20_14_0_80_58_14]
MENVLPIHNAEAYRFLFEASAVMTIKELSKRERAALLAFHSLLQKPGTGGAPDMNEDLPELGRVEELREAAVQFIGAIETGLRTEQ